MRIALICLVFATGLPACGVTSWVEGVAGLDTVDEPPAEAMSGREWETARDVFDRMNAERGAAGLAPLAWDETVSDVAYDHAVDMRVRNFYDHMDPDGMGPTDRLERAGVAYQYASENIALGNDTPEDVMEAWMGSDGHRRNILSTLWTHVGVGVSMGARGPWWAITFYTPPEAE